MMVRAALAQAAEQIAPVSDTPALDAELLLARISGWNRARIMVEKQSELPATMLAPFQTLIERRGRGEPLAYICGEREFWSLPLKVTPDVLIPRPETETLVEWALEILERRGAAPCIADLGTGSGAIALALASERPDAQVVAVDSSGAALALARDNAAALGLSNVAFAEGDWLQPLAGQRFDLIVSNPPYVAPADPHLDALRHEPQLALVADDSGLACLRRIIATAPAQLQAGAALLLEHGFDQAEAVADLLRTAGFQQVVTRPDLAGVPRVTGGFWPEPNHER